MWSKTLTAAQIATRSPDSTKWKEKSRILGDLLSCWALTATVVHKVTDDDYHS